MFTPATQLLSLNALGLKNLLLLISTTMDWLDLQPHHLSQLTSHTSHRWVMYRCAAPASHACFEPYVPLRSCHCVI